MKTYPKLYLLFVLLLAFGNTTLANTKDVFSQYKSSLLQIRIVDVATDSKTTIGSGFFVNNAGLIATNYHVISKHVFEPKQYRIEYVLHDNKKTKSVYQAKLVNFDVIHDLALLQPEKKIIKTPYLKLQNASLTKGEKIFSIGNPHDLGMAIITGTYNGLVDDSINNRIHLSSAINPGMSGGPSITEKGKVIGVNVATAGNQIGFLVPVKYLKTLIKNKEQPKDFIEHIGKQILKNQDAYISRILKKPFKIKKLGHYQVPDKLASYLTCWGDSESKDLPYKISENSCATKNDIYLASNFTTGDIHYSRYHVSAENMSRYRFAYIMEHLYKDAAVFLTGSKKYFTNYECKTEFVTNNTITFKVSFCLRGYKHFSGVYDMMLSAVSLSKETTAIQTNLILAGVSYKNAISFSKKYLEAFSWAP
ncbi:Serine protease precursor MucD/AlgY associated with sigma factor RpoE [hydrothermal vent metagenome]|uniref:Serine protease MucD/AlgY associated with sigma factor RpoE n=1 Tax=hydrothermal vent metagenome TaxID=652676 RepID=A0A3B1A6A9_9ZZZZ